MLKQIPIKKEYLLLAAALMLLLGCYQLAFKKTIAAWQLHHHLEARLAQSSDLSVQPAYLLRKSANLSKTLELYLADTVTFRSIAINRLSSIAQSEGVKLSELPQTDAAFHTSKFIIEKLDFDGDYFALTRVLDRLYLSKGTGIIRSATYKILTVSKDADELKKTVLEVYIEITRS